MTETVPAQTTEVAEAVDFDGENDYLSRSSELTGNADGKTFTFSSWIYKTAAGDYLLQSGGSTPGQRSLDILFSGNSTLWIDARNSSGVNFMSASVATGIQQNTWYHVLVSMDMANTSNRHIYVNDVDVTPSATWYAWANDRVNFAGASKHYVGTYEGSERWEGRLSNFYLDYTYRDLSQEANRRLFITANGKPAANQESLSPIIYLPLKDAATAGQNLGTGGDFTVNGALSTSERGPNQHNVAASVFDGSNYLRNSSLPVMSDGKVFTFYGNAKFDDGNRFFSMENSSGNVNFLVYT